MWGQGTRVLLVEERPRNARPFLLSRVHFGFVLHTTCAQFSPHSFPVSLDQVSMRVLVATGCNVHSNDSLCSIFYGFYGYGLDVFSSIELSLLCTLYVLRFTRHIS